MTYLRLVKGGWAKSIVEARELDARSVIQALYYEEFLGEYEEKYLELNREDS